MNCYRVISASEGYVSCCLKAQTKQCNPTASSNGNECITEDPNTIAVGPVPISASYVQGAPGQVPCLSQGNTDTHKHTHTGCIHLT